MRILFAAVLLVAVSAPSLAQDKNNMPAESSAAVPVDKRPPAEIRAEQLDKLFGALKSDKSPQIGQRTEDRIWSLWMKSDSPTADLLLGQGFAAMKADAFDASEEILDHLIATSDTYAEAYYKRAALYFRMRRLTESLKDLDRVIELEPRHFGALSARGIVFKDQGKREAALAAFEEALAINPHMETIAAAVKEMKAERPDI